MRCNTVQFTWFSGTAVVAALLVAPAAMGQSPRDRATQTENPTAKDSRSGSSTVAPLPLPDTGTTSDWRASKLIGTTMTNILEESVGQVEDVVIDGDGKVVAVVVSVGGFLGLGETSVAIGLRHLVITHADVDRLEVKTSLSRKAIEQAATLDADMDQPLLPSSQ